ncbi:MAG TPA: TIGR04211 family SH3 domain-containing protein [Gammaproteobacteria bacterium]|nr:TIGR04211 family SH3 domain-containing protein [Gammaproteobacteria bacterium]
MIKAIAFLVLLVGSKGLLAETVYVRDTLYVPLRDGQSDESRLIHRGLKSGVRLERLEINDESGYSKVRTESGLEGWLQSQYLVTEPIAEEQLKRVIVEMNDLKAEHQQTLLRLQDLIELKEVTSTEISTLQATQRRLTEELANVKSLASNTISVDKENTRLLKIQGELTDRISFLNRKNEQLNDSKFREWFMYGVATIMLGLLFGLLIGRRMYQRRQRGGWG